MPDFSGLGKMILLLGLVLVVLGGLLTLAGKWPTLGSGWNWLGRLPGDLFIKRDNFTFYFPITTSIVISIVLSVFFYFIMRR